MRALAVLVIAAPALASADVRAFTQTYEYSSQPEGTTSVQLWHLQGRSTWDASAAQAFAQLLEIEHGITEHVDVGARSQFVQLDRGALRFDRVSLVGRYRHAERADLPVDGLVLVEVGKEFARSVYTFEARVVVARDVGRLLLAANGLAVFRAGRDVADDDVLDVGFTAGASYDLHAKLRLGAEAWGMAATRGAHDPTVLAGPALQLAASSRLWLTTTAGFGVTDAAGAFELRAILGLEL